MLIKTESGIHKVKSTNKCSKCNEKQSGELKIIDFLIVLILILGLWLIIYFLQSIHLKLHPGLIKDAKKNIVINDKPPHCVICGSPLLKGESLHSKAFPGEDERLVHVFGCPYCYGNSADKIRFCPVCKKRMPGDAYLVGKMWIKESGKRHLHVTGCTVCLYGSSNK